jgi:putative addiction module component (TIGR02574 family)
VNREANGPLRKTLGPLSTEEAWDAEISRRIEELDSGRAKTISWEEVRQRIATKLAEGR